MRAAKSAAKRTSFQVSRMSSFTRPAAFSVARAGGSAFFRSGSMQGDGEGGDEAARGKAWLHQTLGLRPPDFPLYEEVRGGEGRTGGVAGCCSCY